MKILEFKRHVNKPDESYECELVKRLPGCLILKYVSDRPGRVGDVSFDAGSNTHAYYEDGAGFVLWKMVGPEGRLKGRLFHVCKALHVGEDRVEYLDLLLDIWVDPEGRITVLDQDEVDMCRAQGLIGKKDLEWIEEQEKKITQNAKRLISAFEIHLEANHEGTGL